MSLYSELKELCSVSGASGREGSVTELCRKKLTPYTEDIRTDALGNLIALKKGSGKGRIMLCAHMDEIGFFVNFIGEDGLIRVATVGGIRFDAVPYSKVISERGTAGVLAVEDGVKADDIKADKLYIDIGAESKREAERKVSIGDFFVAEPSLTRLCKNKVCGRPIDDRAGCLILTELAKRLSDKTVEPDVYFVFSVQEEVGCRGSAPAAFGIRPDTAICFDVTATGDTPSAESMACKVGGGAAVKIKDNSVICHEDVTNALLDIAKNEKIKAQREILTYGGTDTSSMQLAGGGAKVGAISVPARYIHSNTELCDLDDIEACIDLAEKYILSYKG